MNAIYFKFHTVYLFVLFVNLFNIIYYTYVLRDY